MKRRGQWGRDQVARLSHDLDGSFARYESIRDLDIEAGGDYTKYLCVRVSGFLEQAIVELTSEYCRNSSWGRIQSFALSHLDRTKNPSSGNIADLLGSFDLGWKTEFESFVKEEERLTSLNSLVGLRNDVAHGKASGLSYQRVEGYYAVVKDVVEWLLARLDSASR